jgi:hypothetical protein
MIRQTRLVEVRQNVLKKNDVVAGPCVGVFTTLAYMS